MKYTIKEIQQKLMQISDVKDPLIAELATDSRKGVQQALHKFFNAQKQKEQQYEKFMKMMAYETKYRQQGFVNIAGIDEVGRGPLAGPVVAACVILPESFYYPGIDDSKKLNEQQRETIFEVIQREAISIGIGIIDNDEIDAINIYEATKKAMKLSLKNSTHTPDVLLIDAMKLDTPYVSESIIKGDSLSISIAAASIIAKVTRDRLLQQLDQKYPQYGFSRNAGYGTKEHLEAIETYGITSIHRKSFAPVKNYLEKQR